MLTEKYCENVKWLDNNETGQGREAELEKCLGELVLAFHGNQPCRDAIEDYKHSNFKRELLTKAKSLLNPDKTDL